MSRSRTKESKFNDYSKNKTSYSKRQSNKKIRRTKDLINGRWFTRIFNTYNIFDYRKRLKENHELYEKYKRK